MKKKCVENYFFLFFFVSYEEHKCTLNSMSNINTLQYKYRFENMYNFWKRKFVNHHVTQFLATTVKYFFKFFLALLSDNKSNVIGENFVA